MFNDNGHFLLGLLEFFLFFAWLMVLFYVFADIFRSKDLGGWGKTLWILFIILLPLLGVLIYLIARGKGMHQRSEDQARSIQKMQDDYIRSVSGGTSPTDQIANAKKLLDDGSITQAEFDQLKAKALAG